MLLLNACGTRETKQDNASQEVAGTRVERINIQSLPEGCKSRNTNSLEQGHSDLSTQSPTPEKRKQHELTWMDCSPTVQKIDHRRRQLGNVINATGNAMDAFFMDWFFGENITKKNYQSNSRGKLYIDSRFTPDGHATAKLGADLRIHLPHTEKRSTFIFSSNDRKKKRRQDQDRSLSGNNENEIVKAGFQVALKKTLNPKAQLGGRWVNNQPAVFFDTGIHHRFGNNEHYIKPEYELSWRKEQSWSNQYSIEYFKKLSNTYGFGSSHYVDDFFKKGYWQYYNNVSLQQKLSDRNALAYTFSISGDNIDAPNIDYHTTSIRWRRRIHDQWLFLEVEPRYTHSVDTQQAPHQMNYFLRLEILVNNIK